MQWIDHSELRGTHALLSPSNTAWPNYDSEHLHQIMISRKASDVGTAIHAFAEECIRQKFRLKKGDERLLIFELRQYDEATIPEYVLKEMDIELIFDNVKDYVNDAIGFHLIPEVVLYYNEDCYGTADAIGFSGNKLRIHDLKTGTSHASMSQLISYAALVCNEYHLDPFKIETELRIYQTGTDILSCVPEPEEIIERINVIKRETAYIAELRKNGRG